MSKLKPEWGTPLRPYTKYKLREQVKNAWRLSDRSKTFVAASKIQNIARNFATLNARSL